MDWEEFMKKLVVRARTMPDGNDFTVKGRDAWALRELIRMGDQGCTPIDNPGPRWSAYIFKLRRDYGLSIETAHETHRGPFPGSHARYILRSLIEIVSRSDDVRRDAA